MSKKTKINLPTKLTILRMILIIPFLILLMLDGAVNQIIALAIFAIAALTDKFDGDYARKHNQVTDLGKFLDPLADKMLVDAAFLYFVSVGIVPVWVFAIILWRDLAVDGIRMMLAQKQVVLAASIWGKVKTTVQMITLIVLMINLIAQNEVLGVVGIVLLCAVVILTVISGLEIIIKGLKKLK